MAKYTGTKLNTKHFFHIKKSLFPIVLDFSLSPISFGKWIFVFCFHLRVTKPKKRTHHGSSIVCCRDGSKPLLARCVPKILNKGERGFKRHHQHDWGETRNCRKDNSGLLTNAAVSGKRGTKYKGSLLCVCELEAAVAMGACQEFTMTWVKNLQLDDKSSNRKIHGLLGAGMLH